MTGFAKLHEMGLSTTLQFDLSRCSSDERETMYNKTVGHLDALDERGGKYKCEQGAQGKVLTFEVTDSSRQSDSGSVSSAATAAMYECVQLMMNELSEAQMVMKAPEKAPELVQEQRSVSTVWDSGTQYYYWPQYVRHPNFIEPKFKDIRDEALNSPVFGGCISAKSWEQLTNQVLIFQSHFVTKMHQHLSQLVCEAKPRERN